MPALPLTGFVTQETDFKSLTNKAKKLRNLLLKVVGEEILCEKVQHRAQPPKTCPGEGVERGSAFRSMAHPRTS